MTVYIAKKLCQKFCRSLWSCFPTVLDREYPIYTYKMEEKKSTEKSRN